MSADTVLRRSVAHISRPVRGKQLSRTLLLPHRAVRANNYRMAALPRKKTYCSGSVNAKVEPSRLTLTHIFPPWSSMNVARSRDHALPSTFFAAVPTSGTPRTPYPILQGNAHPGPNEISACCREQRPAIARPPSVVNFFVRQEMRSTASLLSSARPLRGAR